MKTILACSMLLFGAGMAYAGCVGVNSEYTEYCQMITEQSECTELTGICEWQDSSATVGSCSGQNALCSLITDQQDCQMYSAYGCNWNQSATR